MVEIKYPKYKSSHFQSVLPKQQQQIGELMGNGTIDVFTLNTERTKVWLVMTAENRSELDETINKFVTRRFMTRIRVETLMVYDSNAFHQLPPLVMN